MSRTKRFLLLLALTTSITAHAAERFDPVTQCTDETRGPYPFNYQKIVADYIKATFKDPSSVKDLEIYKPAPGFWSNAILKRTRENTVCNWYIAFSANGKNSYGAYVGSSVMGLWIRNGMLTHAQERTGIDSSVILSGNEAYIRQLDRLTPDERDALATTSTSTPSQTAASGISYIDELRELSKLRDDRVISSAEFEAKKKQILSKAENEKAL
jgi:hypothetical protein